MPSPRGNCTIVVYYAPVGFIAIAVPFHLRYHLSPEPVYMLDLICQLTRLIYSTNTTTQPPGIVRAAGSLLLDRLPRWAYAVWYCNPYNVPHELQLLSQMGKEVQVHHGVSHSKLVLRGMSGTSWFLSDVVGSEPAIMASSSNVRLCNPPPDYAQQPRHPHL
jgi:hypothetical protein